MMRGERVSKNIKKHKNLKILTAYILTTLLLGSVFTFAVSTVTACISSLNGGNSSIVDGNEPVCVDGYTATLNWDVSVPLLKPAVGIREDIIPPSAITGLTAADAGTGGTVNLVWDANTDSDFAHYNIYQDTTSISDVPGMTPINDSITTQSTTSYQVTGLTDRTTYYFAVTAVDNSGNENKTVNDASAVPTTVPTITLVTHDATGILKAGSVLTVTLNGDAGLTATFDVGTVAKWRTMTEGTGVNKGKYTGTYTVQNGDDGTWTVTGHLNSTGTASMDATSNIVIDTLPPTISTVSSSSITDTTATISWTTSENSDSLVEYGTTISYGSTKADATIVASHSIQLTGLTASTLYHYRVKSADSAGNLATSTDYTFTTSAAPDNTAPVATSNLVATASTTSGTTITLTWTAPGDDGTTGTASSYDIRYSTSLIDTDAKFNSATQCTGEPAPKVAGSSETFDVTGLTEGTTYYFAIKTADEVPNWSPISNSPNAKPSVAPAAVTNLATSSPTENSITLTWTAPGDDANTGTASTYDIRYYSSAITESNWASATQCTGESAPKSAGSSESFIVMGLSSSITYYFAIKTGDEVPNWASISNSPSGTTTAPADTTLPTVSSTTPANSATGVAVTTTIAVQFSEPMNKANTEGAFSTSPATTGTFSWNAANDKLTYTPSASLSYSTTYTVSITNSATDLAGNKLDGNGNGVVDNPASKDTYKFSFTTVVAPDTTAPAAITNLAAAPSTTSGTNVTLTWTAPGDDGSTGTASSYDIRYSTSIIDTDAKFNSAAQCSGEPAPKAAGSSETFTVTGLTEGTTYYFAIKTADEVPNWSSLSNSPNAKPSVTPAAITNLATSSPTQNSITLTWTASGDDGSTGTASSYDIRYYSSAITESNWASATQCTGEPAPKSAGSSESFTVTGLSSSTTYYFAIKTGDEVPNWASVSNSPNGVTSAAPDTVLPQVSSTTPANAATGVAVTTTIVVQFSEAMNKANAEGAFSTSPATTGTFSWNVAGDKLTYTPSASLTGGTAYTVTITASATDLAGNPLDGDGDGVQDNPASKDNYVFSFTTAGGGTVNKYAVVIGINTYKNLNNLQYCVNDAADWKSLLTGEGYTIQYLTDSQATEANVKSKMQWLVSTATANDYVVITFSGHGCNAGDVGLSGSWQGICCYDAASYTEVGIYRDTEMQSDLSGLASTHVFIYFDSCRSGGMTEVAATGRLVQMGCAANGYTYDGDSTMKNGVWTWHTIYYYGQGYTCMEDNFAVAAPAASNWIKTNYPGNTMNPVQSDQYSGSFYL